MSLLFCDGFDWLEAGENGLLLAQKGWNLSNSPLIIDGRFSGSAVRFGGGGAGTERMTRSIPSTSTLIFGMAFRNYAGSDEFVRFREGTTEHISLYHDSSGVILVKRGTSVLLATGATPLNQSAWNYIEVKIVVHETAGSVEVRLNGSPDPDILVENVDTQVGGTGVINQIWHDTSGDIDDLYILDTQGGLNNDFLGDIRIATLLPNGAGNYTEWTPSAGDNFAAVDDPTTDDDATYVASDTAGHRDSYSFPSLGLASGTIKGVAVNVHARKDDAAAREVASLVRSNGTDANGTEKAVGASYEAHQFIHELNPDGDVAWTPATVDAAEFGQEVIT